MCRQRKSLSGATASQGQVSGLQAKALLDKSSLAMFPQASSPEHPRNRGRDPGTGGQEPRGGSSLTLPLCLALTALAVKWSCAALVSASAALPPTPPP